MSEKTRIRVVTVDDDRVFRLSIRYMLDTLGYEVVGEASNGDEAIQMAQQLRPDVVLMDVEMPGKSGLEAARDIQVLTPMPIIIISAYEDPATFNEAAASGVAAYLVKPVQQTEVERTISIALARFKDMMEMRLANLELERAFETVKMLEGLLPICVACNKVRDDSTYWRAVKEYIEQQADAAYARGYCKECSERASAMMNAAAPDLAEKPLT